MYPVRFGTCGWSYKEWEGVLYPRGLPAGELLVSYAQHFAVVEVDSTFYRTPGARMVQGWRAKTPAGFGFSLKVPKVITHEKVLLDCREDVESFTAAARLLGDKLLCCLLQFGYFNKRAFANLSAFLERLDPFLAAWPKDVPLAVEVRNKDWVAAPLADCLRRHGTAWALADHDWMPPPLEVVRQLDVVTGPLAYLRLLGDRAAVEARTKVFDHLVIDQGASLQAGAEAVRLLRERVPVLAFANNHFAGYAPGTIRELQQVLGEVPAKAPNGHGRAGEYDLPLFESIKGRGKL
jgi:uncharacterized protein YecE (DUF72 family)